MNLKNNIGNPKSVSLDHICELITITTEKDDLGQFIKSEKMTSVFCSELSITRAEFAAAGQLGHKPTKLLIIDADSYSNELYVLYKETKYTIYKTFQRSDGFIEIYCEVRIGD